MPSNTYGRQVVEALTNKSGGSVAAGDVVVISTGNDGAFTTDTAGAFTGMVGIAQETIANNATGRILTAGYAALVNVNASVTRGNFGKTHTVAKQATDAGSSRVVGVFCQFLTGGTTPTAHLFGITDASTGAGGAPSGAKYIVGAADGTLSAEKVKAGAYDNYDPMDYPSSPNTLDDEFEGGGTIDAKWTKVNDPASSDAMNQTDFAGYLRCGLVELGATDDLTTMIQLYQAAPTGTAAAEYVARMSLSIDAAADAVDGAEFAGCWIYLADSANNGVVGSGFQINIGALATPIELQMLNMTTTTIAGTVALTTAMIPLTQFIWIKLAKTTASAYTSANTYEMYWSLNGIQWTFRGSVSKTFTANCDRVGLIFRRPKSVATTPHGSVLVDYFRRTV